MEDLLTSDQDKADRTIRAFAYLSSQLDKDNVDDVLDCLKPFITKVVTEDRSKPVNNAEVAKKLSAYGLSIPYYALEQLLPRLQSEGILEWDPVLRSHLVARDYSPPEATPEELTVKDFSDLENEIAIFARRLGIDHSTVSESWAEALIRFFKSDYTGKSEIVDLQGAKILETGDIESFIIARFVQYVQTENARLFDVVRRVYAGVLIEDFIQNIQFIGKDNSYSGLSVFYDTSIILRLLGTSGDILRDATLEMHKGLLSLGARTYIISRTRTEVEGILESLVVQYSRGREIYGETADAISEGEVSIAKIRKLAITYMAELANLKVVEFEYSYASRRHEDVFQIDEPKFSELLRAGARQNDRAYSLENAENDAYAVAIVLRLRRGRPSRTVGTSRYLFISKNRLLQSVSRKYAAEETENYDYSSVPPVLSTGQITTAAWLATSRPFESQRVTKELLAACYAAVQPDRAWSDEFASLLETYRRENPEAFVEVASENLTLQNLRRIARDESLNEGAVVGKLNLAKILAEERLRVEQAEEIRKREQEEKIKLVRAEESQKLADQIGAMVVSHAELLEETSQRVGLEERERIAGRFARVVVGVIGVVVLAVFVISIFAKDMIARDANPILYVGLVIVVGSVTVLLALDSFGVPFVKRAGRRLEGAIKSVFVSWMG